MPPEGFENLHLAFDLFEKLAPLREHESGLPRAGAASAAFVDTARSLGWPRDDLRAARTDHAAIPPDPPIDAERPPFATRTGRSCGDQSPFAFSLKARGRSGRALGTQGTISEIKWPEFDVLPDTCDPQMARSCGPGTKHMSNAGKIWGTDY